MSIKKTPAGTILDRADPKEDEGPPPPDDGDVATPKTHAPTEDHEPLE